jgi:pyridoxal phosphate enzyme (YggS family)
MTHADRDQILENLGAIQAGIERAAARAGRGASDVVLVAAAKTIPSEVLRWVAAMGVGDVGQNYVNELRDTQPEVPGVRWHYIGALQTNSVHHVARLADVVQTVTGGRSTERLARRAAEAGRTVEALIEVDFTRERSGVAPEEILAIADRVTELEGLLLRGLMTIPPLTRTAEEARPWFRHLRDLRDRVGESHPEVVELSMGMSLDYEVAVEEGATMVRIGTALFGPRTP